MSNDLTDYRNQVRDVLTAAGIKALEYTSSAMTPPLAAVVPSQPYLTWGDGDNQAAFAYPMRVRLDVLLIGHQQGDAKADAAGLDLLIVQAVAALSAAGIEPRRVTRPGELTVGGVKYLGAVVSVQQDTAEPTAPPTE